MSHTLSVPLFFAVSFCPLVALAQTTSLPPLPAADAGAPSSSADSGTSAPPPTPVDDAAVSTAPLDEAAWRARYADASARLASGDYQAAITAFTALVAAAPTDADKNLALAQVKVATDLSKGVAPETVAPPPTPQEVPAAPRTRTRARSLDELLELYGSTLSFGFVTGLLVDASVQEASHNRDSHQPVLIATLTTSALTSVALTIIDGHTTIRYGVPQSISSGLHLGIEQGIFWSLWDASRTYVTTPSYLHTAGTLWGFSVAGAVAGGVVGGTLKVTPGQASWVGTISLWPALVLGSISLAATGADATNASIVLGERNFGMVGGITSLAGIGVGALTAHFVQPSIARARFIDLAAGAGAVLGGASCLPTRHCREPGVFAGIAAGSGLGFIVALIATQFTGDLVDRVDEHFPALKNVTPTITPTSGGATIGASGLL